MLISECFSGTDGEIHQGLFLSFGHYQNNCMRNQHPVKDSDSIPSLGGIATCLLLILNFLQIELLLDLFLFCPHNLHFMQVPQ